MSPDAPSLAFVLDAPLQSWGTESRFQRRGTGLHPSKSAVLGMIAAALGIDKHSPDATAAEAALSTLFFACAALPKTAPGGRLGAAPRPVRAHQLLDYHTAGEGYDRQTEWMRRCRTADGNVCQNAVVTRRTYLVDARFLVLFQGDPSLLERIRKKLRDPVWGLWLGRKSCPPALPVHPELASTRAAAVAAALSPLEVSPEWETLERWEEQPAPMPLAALINDQPVSFGDRSFRPRSVRHFHPEPPSFTTPDAMFDSLPGNPEP